MPPSSPIQILSSGADIEALVEQLFDPSRGEPVVVVTTRNGEAVPLIDVELLAAQVAPLVVRLVPTGSLTWELTGLLPDRLGVFGGAARIWWPGFSREDPPHRHPLIFAYSPEEGLRAADRIKEELAGRARVPRARVSHQDLPRPVPRGMRPLPVGEVVSGRVTEAAPGGAEVEVAPGWTGWLVRRRRDPELAVGDTVEVRIAGYGDGSPLLERPPRLPPSHAGAGGGAEPETRVTVRPGPHLFPRHLSRTEPGRDGGAPRSPSSLDDADPQELARLRDEVDLLRRNLSESEEERLATERRQEAAELEAARAIRTLARSEREAKAQLRRARDRMAWLEEQLRGAGRFEDAEQQLRHEITLEWERSHVGTDRDAWPLEEYRVGPDFLPSLAALEGVSRAKVVEVCVDVLTGRAATLPSRELHALRASESGNADQRVRPDDGAKAWRVSLQVRTPSARRLHFWRLTDGGVELSCVVVHDDLSIS